jgi:tRNA nucleotidyltransferase (CCA-adding enzyme)
VTDIQIVQQIARSAQKRGWRLLVVGGWVRDQVLERESKDLDCEIYGPESVDTLIEWLSQFGEVNAVGRSFGVLKLEINGTDLDISLPRRENKQGQGHKGFLVEPDSTMTPRDAAARRDFTWNALARR